jgi:hypothetical protein
MLALLLGIFRLIWLLGKGQRCGRAGKRRSSTAARRLQTEAKASPISPTGPLVLDCAVSYMEGLAASLVHRSSGHGGGLAKRAFPSVLGKPVEEVRNRGTTTGQP